MKKIILILAIALISTLSYSQRASKIHTASVVNQGEYVQFDATLTDTLKSNDTVTYVFPVTHVNGIYPIIDLREKLKSTGDTTIAMTVYESMDGITYYAVNAGSSPSAYTKTLAKSVTGIEYNGASDVVWFESRYLKLMFVSPARTGFKKILSGYIKFTIKG
jgi:hypothetical protein